jgi:hypothetical protein
MLKKHWQCSKEQCSEEAFDIEIGIFQIRETALRPRFDIQETSYNYFTTVYCAIGNCDIEVFTFRH